MELKDTIPLMTSDNYKDRFLAEYWQVKIRYNKLTEMCNKWDNRKLDFTPTCSRGMYVEQLSAMLNYLISLEERARVENVGLEWINNG